MKKNPNPTPWWEEKVWYPIYRLFMRHIPDIFWWKPKYKFQHIFRGYSDPSVWNLYYYLARYSLPRLKSLKKNAHGYPCTLKNGKEWNKILDKIIYAMECCADDDFDTPYFLEKGSWTELSEPDKNGTRRLIKQHGFHCNRKKQKRREEKIKEGLKLFGEYFRDLWD